ncbi:hypothetical protein TSAR_016160 [Trichomalopsis sarcophagae]|uniref:Uncharacterized protein n=1 Tax=Trichomalopsis sarcophagae TaxID=543379 RepID=A0A232FGZ1_9HYME|nr:hypothetical protein TSAR_016160 [Trichomalopsis sarcophagae]
MPFPAEAAKPNRLVTYFALEQTGTPATTKSNNNNCRYLYIHAVESFCVYLMKFLREYKLTIAKTFTFPEANFGETILHPPEQVICTLVCDAFTKATLCIWSSDKTLRIASSE